jgi:hypothetical protein
MGKQMDGARWPQTDADYWCGDFVAIPGVTEGHEP